MLPYLVEIQNLGVLKIVVSTCSFETRSRTHFVTVDHELSF
jgi:hypothetical protein